MKLDCELTQELYSQYQDGDLSPGVLRRVNEHLDECNQCREVFAQGHGFILSKEPPPSSLDEKLALSLKLTKLKLILFLILAMVATGFFSGYVKTRDYIFFDLCNAAHHVGPLFSEFDNLIDQQPSSFDSQPLYYELQMFNERLHRLSRHLNLFEQLRLDEYSWHLNHRLLDLFEVLGLRRSHDTFSDKDAAVTEEVAQLLSELRNLLVQERNKPSLLFVDTASLSAKLREINDVTYFYYYYNAFPNELEPLTNKELALLVEDYLAMEDIVVKIDDGVSSKTPHFNVENRTGKTLLIGNVNRYTGKLTGPLSGFATPGDKRNIVDPSGSEESLAALLNRLYGPEYAIQIKYKGLSHPDYKLNEEFIPQHHYDWTLLLDGYRINPRLNTMTASFDARNGNLLRIAGFVWPANPVDTRINHSPEQGREILDLGGEYSFSETIIIESLLTASWVLVHEYTGDQQPPRYLNTVTGQEELRR